MRRRMSLPAALLLLATEARAGDGEPDRSLAGRPARPAAQSAPRATGVRPWLASAPDGATTTGGATPESGRVARPEPEPEETEVPAPTVAFEVSTTNLYVYRGLIVEDEGVIVQSSVEIHVPVLVGTGLVRTVDLGAVLWASLGTGPSGTGGDTHAPRALTEVDATLSITAALAGGWSVGGSYAWFRYPNGSADPVAEIAATIAFDDGPRWPAGGRFRGFSPTLTLAYEARGQSDGGGDRGVFLGIGVSPTFSLTGDPEGASLALSVAGGMSVADYYEGAGGSDETFGYLELGPELELPLGGREGGPSFSLTLGVHVLLAGENLRLYNGTDDPLVIGFVTLNTSF